jgi:hypothetical protein
MKYGNAIYIVIICVVDSASEPLCRMGVSIVAAVCQCYDLWLVLIERS